MDTIITLLLIDGVYFAGFSASGDVYLSADITQAEPMRQDCTVNQFAKRFDCVWLHGKETRISAGRLALKKYRVTYEEVN